MWKVAVGVLLIVGGIAFSGYKYFTGEENKLYEQAKQLEAEGKIYEAHDTILKAIKENFDLTPAGIIKSLQLRQPLYLKTAAHGHFGRGDINLPWEKLDKVEILKKDL